MSSPSKSPQPPAPMPARAYALPKREAGKQAIRLRRYVLAVATYALSLPLLWVAHLLGYISAEGVWHIVVIFVLINGALYGVFRSGFNLRFADPSLTLEQSFLATSVLMYTIYLLNAGHEMALMMCLVIFVFGIFRLSRRDFLFLTLYVLAAYAVVLHLMLTLRPGVIDLNRAWMSWLVMAAFLPWFSAVGGKISQMRQAERKTNLELTSALTIIRRMATHDELTGLANRALFVESLQQALARTRRTGARLSVLYVDVDRFKRINDSLGHRIGDAVLGSVAKRLKASVRVSDFVARVGGDEFAVVMEMDAHGDAATAVARKLLAAFEPPLPLEGHELHVEVSIGIATCPLDGTEADELVAKAELAMQRSRRLGPSRFQHYAAEMNLRSAEHLELENGLRRAIERDELRVHYQAKIDLATGRVAGAEALLRWQRPEQGLVSPARFIPLAEETGLIVPIGRWLLRRVCADLHAWRERGLPPFAVAINLSTREFRSETLARDVLAALEEFRLPPRMLEFEITESMVMAEPERAAALMHELRRAGIGLALDDFGTGYSSLAYLKLFPLTHLKIDRSFVNGLPGDRGDAAISATVIALARALGLGTVAEGVESAAQAALLRDQGCAQAQGFYFARPLPEADFVGLLGLRGPLAQAALAPAFGGQPAG